MSTQILSRHVNLVNVSTQFASRHIGSKILRIWQNLDDKPPFSSNFSGF